MKKYRVNFHPDTWMGQNFYMIEKRVCFLFWRSIGCRFSNKEHCEMEVAILNGEQP